MIELVPWNGVLLQDNAPVPFRYVAKPKAMINVFEPKAVQPEQDMRSSVMGASCGGLFQKFPKTATASILWEVT